MKRIIEGELKGRGFVLEGRGRKLGTINLPFELQEAF